MRFIYILLVYLAAPVISLVMLSRGLKDRSHWRNFRERYGFGPQLEPSGVWIHAVSVGEVQAAAPLVNSLRQHYPDIPLVMTTLTVTGANRARSLFKDGVRVRYVPFDLPGAVRRFFNRVQPRLAVIFETELWPNLYHECGRRRIPLVLASARISARSVSRYRRLGSLFRDALSGGVVVAAQAGGDAQRFQEIGADPQLTHVTGNLKFDFAVPPNTLVHGRRLREQYGQGRPVWVAGSTHRGEEEAALEAHRIVMARYPEALLVLVPRHPNRFDDVAEVVARSGLRFVRRSQVTAGQPQRGGPLSAAPAGRGDVLLVDTLGELLDFYAAADVAFVGGSLVPIGGHNLLEPAALGLPILTGPHNFNSEDIARLLLSRGAAEVVQDARALGNRVVSLLANPEERARIGAEGRASVDSNRGALAKLLGLINPLLQQQ
ncbi:MAG TPA: lipid IV(A) 3-deoxy-D-manno-octulosonic acid transferase [Steroidobacteraceae bacterium]